MRTIVVCTSLAGILLLYGYSLTLEPKFISTAEVADHVGQMVRLEGYVVDLSMTPGGDSAFMTLRDDHGTVSVFVKGDIRNVAMDSGTDGKDTQLGAEGVTDGEGEGDTDEQGDGTTDREGEADPGVPVSDPQTRYGKREKRGAVMVGDLIVITGQVYESELGYGISVSGPQFIRILVPWSGKIITLQALTSNPARFEGMNVNLSCRIISPITDSEGHGYGVVSDHEEGNHSLPVYVYGIPVHRGYRGMEGHVNARFEYRRTNFRYVLIIDGPEHHIWASVEAGDGR